MGLMPSRRLDRDASQADCSHQAYADSNEHQRHALAEHQLEYFLGSCAQSHTYADFSRALTDGIGHDSVDPRHGRKRAMLPIRLEQGGDGLLLVHLLAENTLRQRQHPEWQIESSRSSLSRALIRADGSPVVRTRRVCRGRGLWR